ncbi:hypothetical protein EAJ18_10245 [Citrobacter amalonaticus]|uniref:Uncharacterized protein n=1 Tax=Citrobacter amalonaticus TaxID=35703 RepID=A0ABY0HTY4_CITAM|nr:hypothetical protein AL524_25135 [Citrobacter amalonaticus]RYT43468.1 hypothetical protein EAJ18_10245 [Citrobacter amalonaticus]
MKPNFSSCSTVFGVAATRVSLVNRSFGMPIRIMFPSIGIFDDGLSVNVELRRQFHAGGIGYPGKIKQ